MPPRQRRVTLVIIVLGALGGSVFGWLAEGAVLAIVEGTAFLASGAVVLWIGPIVKPSLPRTLPRPTLGSAPAAVRRRREERLVAIGAGLPIMLSVLGLALVAPTPGARLAAGGAALALAAFYGYMLWRLGGDSAAADRRRQRLYQRQVERMTEERRWYEEHADPARTRRRLLLCAKVAGLLAVSNLPILLLASVLLTERRDSPDLWAAGVAGPALLAVAALLTARGIWARRRR